MLRVIALLEYKMKPNIHPDYHEITVKMTNGSTFKTRSTYGKAGSTLQLDVDPNTHPAWTGANSAINEKAGRVAAFNQKFGSLGSTKKAEEKKEENN